MAAGIQTQVNVVPAPAVEGDFASSNPRVSMLEGPGGFVAGASGVTVGRFAWASNQFMDADNAPAVLNNFGAGPVTGFIHRGQQGLNTTFLAGSSMLIPAGFGVGDCFTGGDFWAKNNGTIQALPGMKAYANTLTGAVSFAATGTAGTTSLTTSSIAAGTTIAATGSISGNVLTITAISAGTIYPGTIITGTNIATGTQVVSQLSGTPQGIGTYSLSIGEQTIVSEAIAGTYGVLTVGAGTPISGGVLSGSGVTPGTVVFGQLTPTTWVVSPSQTAASTTIAEATSVETKWIARSGGLVGELVKISDQPLG